MKSEDLFALLEETGVIMEGHFLLTSGRHSNRFLQCSQILQYPGYAAALGSMLAEPFRSQGVTAVIGPAMGGVILAYETARVLGARALYAEAADEKMVLRRGFKLGQGEKVLVVEDAVSTGGSVQKVLDLIQTLEIKPVGVSVLIDRSGGKVDFGLKTSALLELEIESFDPESCPLCAAAIPLQRPKN